MRVQLKLGLKRRRDRVRRPRERAHHAVALSLLYRTHPIVPRDRPIEDRVSVGDRAAHRLPELRPQPRRSLDVAQEKRRRPRRQMKPRAPLDLHTHWRLAPHQGLPGPRHAPNVPSRRDAYICQMAYPHKRRAQTTSASSHPCHRHDNSVSPPRHKSTTPTAPNIRQRQPLRASADVNDSNSQQHQSTGNAGFPRGTKVGRSIGPSLCSCFVARGAVLARLLLWEPVGRNPEGPGPVNLRIAVVESPLRRKASR